MTKNNKSKILNQKAPFLFVVLLAFILFLGDLVLFDDHVREGWVLGVSKKYDQGNSANSKAKKIENVTPKTSNSKAHVEKVKTVIANLEEVALVEEEVGNDGVSEEITEAAEGIETEVVDSVEPIDAIEERPAWKNFLLGPSYKNLGQLRSSLVHSDNGIRKITKNMARVEGAESDTALQAQLGELNRERDRIVSFIKEQEQNFSLFGWLSKLINGYESDPTEVEVPVTPEPTELTE